MADSVVKLRIDSKEYDANIKRAGQALTDYFNKVRAGGGTLEHLDEGVLDAVKALGQLGTQAGNAKGSLRELTQTTADMLSQYRMLTDAERSTPLGKAMAESIDALTERAGVLRDAMDDVNATIQHSASDTRIFDEIAGGAQLATAGFQTFQGAAKLVGIELGDNVEVLAKLQAAMAVTNGLQQLQNLLQRESAFLIGVKTVQTKAAAAAEALATKRTIAATVAQRALNLVAKANPYVLIATAATAAVTAIAAFGSKSRSETQQEKDRRELIAQAIKRERDERERLAQRASEQANKIAASTGDVVAKYKILQTEWNSLNNAQERNNFIKENATAFKSLGVEIKTSADAMSFFVTNSAKVLQAMKAMAKAEAVKSLLTDAYKEQFTNDPTNVKRSEYTVSTREMTANAPSAIIKDSRGYNGLDFYYRVDDKVINKKISDYIASNPELQAAGFNVGDFRVSGNDNQNLNAVTFSINAAGAGKLSDFRRNKIIESRTNEQNSNISRLEGLFDDAQNEVIKAQSGLKFFNGGGGGGGNTNGNTTTRELTKEQQLENDINKLVQEGLSMDEESRKTQREKIAALQKELDQYKSIKNELLGIKKEDKPQQKVGNIRTSSGLTEFINGIKNQLGEAEFGSEIYKSLSNSLADTSMLQSLVGESLRLGLGTAMFDAADELGRDFWTRAMEGGVENVDWDAILAKINEKRKENGLDELIPDYQTGTTSSKPKEKKDDKKDEKKEVNLSQEISKMGGGISSMVSGIEGLGIEMPKGLQDVVNGIQSVTTILTGISSIVSAIAAIASADAIIPFAGGGIVGHAAGGMLIPGNSFSGDRLRMPVIGGGGMIGVNSGELILNRLQQDALARELSGDSAGFAVQPYVDGEKIFLGMNNTSRRMGRGEIVTTSTLRRYGLI